VYRKRTSNQLSATEYYYSLLVPTLVAEYVKQ
jgi:hypothetical protein